MNLIKELEDILNGNYTVKEKKCLLDKFKDNIKTQVEEVETKIEEGYTYCPKCEEWYKDKAWETDIKQEVRNICTYHDAGYGDDDRYEDVNCTVTYMVCPLGHRVEMDMYY